jgi:hypothetical protein
VEWTEEQKCDDLHGNSLQEIWLLADDLIQSGETGENLEKLLRAQHLVFKVDEAYGRLKKIYENHNQK